MEEARDLSRVVLLRQLRHLPSPLSAVLLVTLAPIGAACDADRSAATTAATETCLDAACHGAIEQIHYGGPPLSCTDCHLGDGEDPTKEGAHVTVETSFNPSTPGVDFLEAPSLRELDELPLDVIRFLNPSDYRVAEAACGTTMLGGAVCHPNVVSASLLMTRATLSGQLAGGLFMAGAEDPDTYHGVVDTVDVHTPEELAEGTVDHLVALTAEAPDSATDPVAAAFYPVVEQLCLSCHLYQDGAHRPGLYYSSGCNACHMETSDTARAETLDLTQDREELGHVRSHRFTNLVPDSQCAHCHVAHIGRAMLTRGLRARSHPEGDQAIGGPNRGVEDPPRHVAWGEENYLLHEGELELYGQPYPHYIDDEDGSDLVDETPPNVHTTHGMGCIDCHNIREAHGDDSLAVGMDTELDVRCESCHGRPGERATLRSDAGLAFNRAVTAVGEVGQNEPIFEVSEDGTVLQRVRFTNALHAVTQITESTDPSSDSYSPETRAGCELHSGDAASRAALKAEVNALALTDPEAVAEQFPGLPSGFLFDEVDDQTEGRLECFTCHNTWTANQYGRHLVRDDRESYTSPLTGEVRTGAATAYDLSVVADGLALGFNARGRITPLVGEATFFTHIDAQGERVLDAVPLTDGAGRSGAGNPHEPVHHHTSQLEPRPCTGCHPAAGGDSEPLALLTALGLGSGRYTFLDGAGVTHWLDQLVAVDLDGDGVLDDPQDQLLPDRVFAVEPIAGSARDALPGAPTQAGPLDLETINRTLEARVQDQ